MSGPSVRFYQIPVGAKVPLADHVKTDGIVIFRSSALNLDAQTNNTSVNLLGSDGAIILHIGLRRVEDVIVFNSRTSGGAWLQEQRVKFSGSFQGQNHTITVYDHGDRYQVLTNGNTRIYYAKQLKGDVTELQYIIDPNQSPIFSNNIAAQTFSNFAALVPGSS